MKPVLLDTSVIVALLDRSENLHEACAETVRELKAPLTTCEAVIAESCYLLRSLSGAPEAVIENIAAGIFRFLSNFRERAPQSICCGNTATVILIGPMRA